MSVLARALKWQRFRAYVEPLEETKYAPSWSVGTTADNVYSDRNYGEMWQAPQSFKLSAIEVPLSKHGSYPQCTNGIMDLYHGPVCDAGRGTLLVSVTKTLPSLPTTPSYTWVKFDFDPVVSIISGEIYAWLLVGCVPRAGNTFYRVMIGVAPLDGVSLQKLMWLGDYPSPYLDCDEPRAQPFRMYKSRLI
jgi:hypothetical protein